MRLIQPWGPDLDRGGGSRAANRDERINNQRLSVPSVPTPTPSHEGDNTRRCGRVQLLGPVFIHSPVALHSAERGPTIQDLREQGNGVPGIQRPSETTPERTPGGDRDRGDAHDMVQPGAPSRGRFGSPPTPHYGPY